MLRFDVSLQIFILTLQYAQAYSAFTIASWTTFAHTDTRYSLTCKHAIVMMQKTNNRDPTTMDMYILYVHTKEKY